jgi:hypothetical protein
MRRYVLVSGLVFAGTLAACGGDDGGSDTAPATDAEAGGDALPLDEWIEEVDGICAEMEDEIANTVDRPSAGPFSQDLDEDDFAEISEFLDGFLTLQEAALADIEGLGVPEEETDEVEEFLAALQSYLDDLAASLEAARDEDGDALADAFLEVTNEADEAHEQASDVGLENPGGSTISMCGPSSPAPTGDRTGSG